MDGLSDLTALRFAVTPVYWAAAATYVAALSKRTGKHWWVTTAAAAAAVALHLGEYLGRGALAGEAGGAPFTGLSGFLSLASLILAVVYLLAERRLSATALGAFTLPVVAVLHTVSLALYSEPTALPEHLTGPLLVAHVALVTAAYVALSAALVTGVSYLALDRALRQRRTGKLFRRLPNLDLVARSHWWSLVAGAALLGVNGLLGSLWARSVWGFYFSWDQPKLVITLLSFCVALSGAVLWRSHSWRGRRAAWLVVTGVTLNFVALALSSTFVDELHRFG